MNAHRVWNEKGREREYDQHINNWECKEDVITLEKIMFSILYYYRPIRISVAYVVQPETTILDVINSFCIFSSSGDNQFSS